MPSLRFTTKIVRSSYTLLFCLGLPFVFLRLLKNSRKTPAYRQHWQERLGFVTPSTKPSIWIHSVSVGETLSAIPLMTQLIEHYPTLNIHITTTTPTGREQVINHLGNQVTYSYVPYDIPNLIKRFIKRLNVVLCIVMETEVWPNMLTVCRQKHIPILLANARLSEKSYENYARFRSIAYDIFNLFNLIAAQNKLDADHYIALGVPEKNICITGSIKFERAVPADIQVTANQLRHEWNLINRPVIVAASTREGEEPFILEAFATVKKTHPNAFLLLIPRHPKRVSQVAQLCQKYNFSVCYRSQQANNTITHDILIGDTIGELLLFYALADITYVGGSLVNTGGHNILEPAALRKPIITGPYLRNFKAISETLVNANAQLIVQNAEELAHTWNRLIDNPADREALGNNALAVYESNQGATARHLEIVTQLLPSEFSDLRGC